MKKEAIRSLEQSDQFSIQPTSASTGGSSPVRHDNAGSPSQEATSDPAPTRHEPATEQQRLDEKSKYESSSPYRSRKGDRFS